MSQGPAKSPSSVAEPHISERLESWKEVASYLKRGVRTVQRWEREEGLPVHRHMHDKLGTVYAYRTEINAWWANGRSRLEAEVEPAAESRPWFSWRLLAVAVALVAAVGTGWWLIRPQTPVLPFAERDWVLIAAFENRTGEQVFDDVIEHALERELSNSRFVNVAPRERVNDTLALMRKPLDTRLDAGLAREVSLRDGGIRALISGRVEKLDSTYLLSASLVNPADGVTVASFSEEAAGQKEVVPALRRLSSRVRRSLGEELSAIRQGEQSLEKVTTPSLRALQLYSRGMALVNDRRCQQAAEILERAVSEDPDFASAHILLAHCYSNLRKDNEAAPHYQRAFGAAESTTDRERYFILGSYYSRFLKDDKKAVEVYEVLVRLYPDHYWGVNNLAVAYERLGRENDAVRYLKRRADLRPSDFQENCRAVLALARVAGNLAEAKPYWVRARGLATPAVVKQNLSCAAFLEVMPAYDHWLRDEVGKALAEADRVRDSLSLRSGEEKAVFATFAGGLYHDLGKLRQAEELYQLDLDPAIVHWNLARVAEIRSDQAAFRKHVQVMSHYPDKAWWLGVPIYYAKAGLLREAQDATRRLERGNTPGLDIARGELLLARRKRLEAIPVLRAGMDSVRNRNWGEFFAGADALARALEEVGSLEEAAKVLEEAVQKRALASAMGDASTWIQFQNARARLYRKLGREQEAQKIEAELGKLLAYADEDHPILRELKRRQEAGHRTSANR